MSKCSLEIELESGVVRGGEPVCGEVLVKPTVDVRCEALVLCLSWRTAGRGNRDACLEREETLYSGPWSAEQTLRYPFSFPLPHRPLSHDGELLRIEWVLTARASVPWAMDPESEIVFEVRRGLSPPRDARTVPPMPPMTAQQKQGVETASLLTRLLPGLAGCGIAGVGTVAALVGVATAATGQLQGVLAAITGGLFIFFGLRNAWNAGGTSLARRRLKDITINIASTNARPGEALRVSAGFRPAQALAVRDIRLRLILRESASTGVDDNRTTHTHDHVFSSKQLSGPSSFAAEERFDGETILAIPPDAPPSFSATSNRLLWLVQLDIDIDDWPDLNESHPFLVS